MGDPELPPEYRDQLRVFLDGLDRTIQDAKAAAAAKDDPPTDDDLDRILAMLFRNLSAVMNAYAYTLDPDTDDDAPPFAACVGSGDTTASGCGWVSTGSAAHTAIDCPRCGGSVRLLGRPG